MSARRMTKAAKAAVAALESEGLELVEWSGGGDTHYKFRVKAPNGRTGLIVCSASPSDRNTITQVRGNARAFLRGTL